MRHFGGWEGGTPGSSGLGPISGNPNREGFVGGMGSRMEGMGGINVGSNGGPSGVPFLGTSGNGSNLGQVRRTDKSQSGLNSISY